MSYSRRSRYSPSPYRRPLSRSFSRSLSRSRSRSYDSSDVENPGNNLYVTGLSSRVTEDDLQRHFEREGEVTDVHLVTDPWTRESRGFGFVTMASLEEANNCVKCLDRSVLEGRVITVEKARRRRGRTPTPGRYLGARTTRERRRSPSYSPDHGRRRYSYERETSYTPSYHGRYHSRSPSPYYRSRRSPYYRRYDPPPLHYRRYDDLSPPRRRYRGSYSRYSRSCSRSVSPDYRGRHRYSTSPSASPRRPRGRSYSRSVTPRRSRRSYSRSQKYSRCPSYSPEPRSTKRSSVSSRRDRGYSRESYTHSRSGASSRSGYASRSYSPSPGRTRRLRKASGLPDAYVGKTPVLLQPAAAAS